MIAIPSLLATSRPASVVQTSTNTDYPVTLDEAKAQVRVTGSDEDPLIQGYIAAATEYVQGYQWSQLITATFVQRQDFFPPSISPISLYRNPNPVVTSIQYLDTGGVTQTLDPTLYVVDPYIVPALIVPAYTKFWPTSRWHINDVTVTYTAGYGASGAAVPQVTKQAILLLVSQWYWNREATSSPMSEAAFAVKALLDLNSYRTFF